MKLANDITKSSNKNWDVPGLDAIHILAPITGIDARSMNNFKNPITVLLNLYIFQKLNHLVKLHNLNIFPKRTNTQEYPK